MAGVQLKFVVLVLNTCEYIYPESTAVLASGHLNSLNPRVGRYGQDHPYLDKVICFRVSGAQATAQRTIIRFLRQLCVNNKSLAILRNNMCIDHRFTVKLTLATGS